MTNLRGLFAWGLGVGLAACSGPSEPAASPESPPASTSAPPPRTVVSSDQLCQAYCDRWDGCGKPAQYCECQADGKDLSVFNPPYIARLMLCLDGVPCANLEAGTAWSACHDTTLDALQPSEKLRSFCFEHARRAAACGTPDAVDQSACLVKFRHVSEAALDDASSCLEQECAEVPRCVGWALSPK